MSHHHKLVPEVLYPLELFSRFILQTIKIQSCSLLSKRSMGCLWLYSYHYRKVLKRRILDKRKDLTGDLHLITLAEDKLQRL